MDKDLRLQVILGAVNKMTAPMKAAQSSNRKLTQAIQSTRKEIRALDSQSGRVAGFRKNKQALAELSGKMREAQSRVKELAAAIKRGGSDTATLTREQKKAIEAARKLKVKHAELSVTLQRERSELAQSGINTRKLASAQGELKNKTRQATQALEAQQKRLKISGEAQARYQSAMSKRNSMLIGGGISMAKGTAGLYALNKPLDESKHYQQEVSQFRALGVDDKTIRDAQQFSDSLNVIGNSVTDNMRTLKEAHSVLRHYDEAKMVTPELLKMQYATKFMTAGQGEVLRDQSQAVLKIAELRNEINTPEQFKNSVNLTTQAFAASGGLVKPEDYLEAIKTGGESTKNLDDKFFYFGLSHIIQQLGGDRTGTALASLYKGWQGKRMSEKAMGELDSIGLAKNVTYSKAGLVKDFTLVNQELYQRNPFEYLQKEVLPRIKKKYPHATEQQIRNILYAMTSNSKGADLLLLMYREQANIEKQIKAGGEAYNIDQLVGEGEKTPYGKEIALQAKKQTLYKNIGDKIMPMYVWGLEKLDNALTWLGKFIDNHPQLAKFFLLTATGISLAAVAGGALTVAMAGLLGPLAVARYGFSALTGREMPALGRGILWLVRSPFAMLRNGAIAIGSTLAALGWPVTLLIGALVAGAFLVWKYWDRVKAWFGGFLEELKPAWEAIKDLFAPLIPIFDWIGEKVKAVIKWFEDFLTPVKSSKEELDAATESGRNFGKLVAAGLMGVIDTAKTLFGWIGKVSDGLAGIAGWAWNGIKDTFSNTSASPISPSGIPFGGTFDSGGTLAAGRWGIVGERGPEVITGPASIMSRSRTAGLADLAMSFPALLMDSVQAMFPLQSPETLPLHPHAIFTGADSPAGRHHTDHYSDSVMLQPVIHIHAAPTQNAQDIADMVMRALKKEQRRAAVRSRSTYRDRR